MNDIRQEAWLQQEGVGALFFGFGVVSSEHVSIFLRFLFSNLLFVFTKKVM